MREALAIAAAMVAPMVASAATEAPGRPAARLTWPGKSPAAAAPTPPAIQPAVTTAAVPAAAAPTRADGPRRYSLHREVGQTPDRPELPPEFFLDGPPVDLADPPPQPPSDRDERRQRALEAAPDNLSN